MADKRSKKIKFALYLKNDEEVRTKRDLKENFDMVEIIGYLFDGRLSRWMRDHDYPPTSWRAVEELREEYEEYKSRPRLMLPEEEKRWTRKIIGKLCEIFDVDESKIGDIKSIEQIRKASLKTDEIINIAAFEDEDEEEEILQYVNQIVRTQPELKELLARLKEQKKTGKFRTVYLVRKDKPYELSDKVVFETPLRFVGINQQAEDDKTEIKITQPKITQPADDEGKTKTETETETVNIERVKAFLAQQQNRGKFSNLKIVVRKRTSTDTDGDERIDCPKIKISSTDNSSYDAGIDVAADSLMLYLDAGLPIIYIDTFEEDKADEIIRRVAAERDVYEWNKAEGLFKRDDLGNHIANFDNRLPLDETLQKFIDDVRAVQYGASNKCQLKNSVLVLKDIQKYFEDEDTVAQVKYLAQLIYTGKLEDCTIVIVSSVLKIPSTLEHYLTILKIGNLNEKEIEKLIKDFCREHGANKPSDILMKKLLVAFKGMSEFDIINILSLALAGENKLSFSDLDLITENKKQLIRKTKILEMVECDKDEDDIGGLEHLKAWLNKKRNTFKHMDEALRHGVRIPKGILIVGMPGCGKTLTAKATAAIFELPLFKLDMGRILGKYVGESEKNIRRATELAEVSSPCVLWIDEMEKAFAGTGGDGGGEVTMRLLGLFLTWMQEKTSPVFVVATANSVDRLPPELLRRGRFDEIFYVGTPNATERKDIFNIYMEKIRNSGNFAWPDSKEDEEKIERLARSTLGCSGADIANFVADAVEKSFSDFMESKKYLTTKISPGDERKIKPLFNPDIVQEVVDVSGKVSAWNQLKLMFGNYRRKKFKNASQQDFRDLAFWLNLRIVYLVQSPRRIFSTIGTIVGGFRTVVSEYYLGKINAWEVEEHEGKDRKLPLSTKIFRQVAVEIFKLLEPPKPPKTVNLEKTTEEEKSDA